MVSDERRRELLASYFASRAALEYDAYVSAKPNPHQLLRRARLKLALATVCHHFPAGGRVLDLGSGCGLAAGTLADLGFDVTAVELVPELFQHATKEHGTKVQWLNQPFDTNVGKKSTFDVVLSLGFLEYQERAGKELVKMRRMLKPGGLLILSVPNTLSPRFGFGLTRAYFRIFREPESIPVRHSFTPERLQRLLGMAGFILLDYKWLPHGEDSRPLSEERGRDFVNHRLKLRTEPEMLTLSRTYRPEDTAL
jgi:2-polyprenyl-3-methyl-5-hydroxy-6-metoxy-1,4-benzoquinol methylase